MTPAQIAKTKQQISALAQAKNYSGAARLAEKLVALNPQDIQVWWVLSQLQLQSGKVKESIRSLYQVCQGPSPLFAQAVERSVGLSIANEFWDLAVPPAQELVKLKPKDKGAWAALGRAWYELGCYINAEPMYRKVLELDSSDPEAIEKLAFICNATLRHDEGVRLFERLSGFSNATYIAQQYLAGVGNYSGTVSDDTLAKWHFGISRFFADSSSVSNCRNIRSASVRLGFISEDFRHHSVAFFLLPILRNLSKERWQVFCYSGVRKPDAFTEKFKGLADEWRDVIDLDHVEVASLIRDDQIDLLIDLQGLTGNGWLPVFAQKPAPLQITYLGYPNTTGLQQMDYRLIDGYTDPEGQDESGYSEKLVRLPGGFLCYCPEEMADCVVGDLPAVDGKFVTFASFNILHKLTPAVLGLWAKILKRVEGSRLLVKSKPLKEPELQELLYQRFERKGIERSRIELIGWTESQQEHMALYNKVDIHLDTYPYNGTTTTCEALWQGVPTVTLSGKNHRSRVGLSILSQLGMEDWVASSEEDYIDLAVAKARDLSALADLRVSLRERMSASPLMDAEGFARRLESAFEEMIARHNAKLNATDT